TLFLVVAQVSLGGKYLPVVFLKVCRMDFNLLFQSLHSLPHAVQSLFKERFEHAEHEGYGASEQNSHADKYPIGAYGPARRYCVPYLNSEMMHSTIRVKPMKSE